MNTQLTCIIPYQVEENNKTVRYIFSKEAQGKIVIDFLNIDAENIVFDFLENSHIELLELHKQKNVAITYNFGKYSNIKLQIFDKEESLDTTYDIHLKEGSELLVAYADFSSGKKKVNANVFLEEKHAKIHWHLASLSQNQDVKNYEINFKHLVGETWAKMENYGVCKDKSSLFFLGDATICKGAAKSSTSQNAKIMVFDSTCHAKASPKLCIYENDVEASHGASEGQINPEHVFYLMSRGLNEEEAKRLITLGYLSPIIQYFEDENLKNDIEDFIVKRV